MGTKKAVRRKQRKQGNKTTLSKNKDGKVETRGRMEHDDGEKKESKKNGWEKQERKEEERLPKQKINKNKNKQKINQSKNNPPNKEQ